MATGKTPYQILEVYAQRISDSLRDSLVKNERYVSGGLAKSIEARVKVFGQSINIQVYMADYWKFVDEGVNGTKVKHGSEYSFKKKNINKDAMLKHIANRGSRFAPMWKDIQNNYTNKKGLKVKRKKPLDAQVSRNSLAFLLGRSISKKGFKGTGFVDEGIQGIEKDLERDLLEAVGREIEVQLTVK